MTEQKHLENERIPDERQRRYIDLSPAERGRYERAFGGRLPVDAEVSQLHGWTQIGISVTSPIATDEDLLITGAEQ